MKTKAKVLLTVSLLIAAGMIANAIIQQQAVLPYLGIFFFVGLGLAMLRLFVNGMIKKMKGKHIGVKVLFFAVLLGFGIPFQNWFRTDVILAMSTEFIIPCIIIAVASMVFMTVLYGVLYERKKLRYLEPNIEKALSDK